MSTDFQYVLLHGYLDSEVIIKEPISL